MTPKTQPTTLQLARELIRCEKEIHFINHGYATIEAHLPGVDTEREEALRAIVKEAHGEAQSNYLYIHDQYEKRIKAAKKGGWRRHDHIYKLRDLAREYAWK